MNEPNKMKNQVASYLALGLLLILVFVCYFTGFNSPFIFDDAPNLDALSQIHGSGFFTSGFWEFVFSGNSGPTGRPVSLISFALQAESWPNNPSAFKFVNFLIHAFVGCLVYIFCHQISRLLDIDINTKQSLYFCFFITAIWILHPVHSGVVLYTVQRMALLSNAFILLGIVIHIHLRLSISQDKPWLLVVLATLSLGITGILALFSKENAPSLALYLLTLEYTLLRSSSCVTNNNNIFKAWRLICLWLPALMMLVLSFIFLSDLNQSYENARDYTMLERLLTQSRVLWAYLNIIALPSIADVGLFHSFTVSDSLFSPFSTFVSVSAWVCMVFIAIKAKQKHALITFAICWYFAGHAIESTILPLELFFNHRNYLAFLGPLIALVYYLFRFSDEQSEVISKLMFTVGTLIVLILSFQLFSISTMWSKPQELAASWYLTDPDTPRNGEFYAIQTAATGDEGVVKAAVIYDQIVKSKPTNFRYFLNRMTMNCLSSSVPLLNNELIQKQLLLRNQKIERNILEPLKQLVSLRISETCTVYSSETLGSILNSFHLSAGLIQQGFLEYEMAQLQLYLGHKSQAESLFESAYNKTDDPGILFTYSIHLINEDNFLSALEYIDEAVRQLNISNNINTGTRSSKLKTLAEMRKDVEQFIENSQAE